MDILKFLCLIFLCSSCAKVGYLIEQGRGQLALEYNDIDVEDFLEDSKQKEEHKNKVKIIVKAKKHFYKYFAMEDPGIYDEVKILNQDAVTYLVIHSPKNEIKAISTSFPIVGSFPYLGFFKLKSAKKFKAQKEEEGFSTYMRPVYAYSTLNHPLMPFDDNILSSFFFLEEKDLVELIFHELTHTIIFVGDNVAFNENLASFVAEKLLMEYYKFSPEQILEFKSKQEKHKKLSQKIGELAKELNQRYKNKKIKPEEILSEFLEKTFNPKLKTYCNELELTKCWPIKTSWNNARFAAYGTYTNKMSKLEKIFKKSGLSLKDFVKKLMQIAEDFDEDGQDFLTYFENRL